MFMSGFKDFNPSWPCVAQEGSRAPQPNPDVWGQTRHKTVTLSQWKKKSCDFFHKKRDEYLALHS